VAEHSVGQGGQHRHCLRVGAAVVDHDYLDRRI